MKIFFHELAVSALNAFCLPLSNAVVERVFSHVTNKKLKLHNKLSVNLLSAVIRIKTEFFFFFFSVPTAVRNFLLPGRF